ncbi:hypothetical protein GGTG_02359 [Gaeumannomyces tritici R3-111a-1]|uniref:Uncharacterized protein n=1 Tax=Gaeumannomyces tritici (strain R3-111a-1) TaxID=644352 RepID=J3NM55_GAET3|nr:hypothetical protein GGTG_02359 [Gaeumannomyces tritici R3-111a-1]EJT82386.1 hypothetical protein GGTG_02359 [Gaeumannomyces tritici R3-111a-1]
MDSDLRKPHMAVRHRPHLFGRLLHVLALLLLALTFFLFILVCISGTWLMKEDNKWRLALGNFSMVEFDGIIPKPNTKDEYSVKMHLTLASFGWEYLNATKKEMQAGIVYQGFAQTLKFPDHLRDVAKRLDLPSSDYDCLHPNQGTCRNDFFNKFRDVKEMTFVTWVQWLIVLLGLFFLLVVFVKDVLITFKKSWMKCHCCFLSSLCPNPKGSAEENATLPPSFWDGLRLYWYATGFVYMFVVSIILTVRSRSIVDELKKKNVPGARVSDVFLVLIWFGVVCMFVAVVCMGISKLCNRGRERQVLAEASSAERAHSSHSHLPPGGPYGGPAPQHHHHQEPYPAAFMPPEPSMPSQVPHPANAGGFNDVNITTPPTYGNKASENPYEKS